MQIGKDHNAEYILSSAKKGEMVTTKYYICHRSGMYKEDVDSGYARKRKLKSQGTCKLNFNCTSTIKCRVLNNCKHEVEFIKTHYGHQCDIQHLKISNTNSVEIASKLVAGVSKQRYS